MPDERALILRAYNEAHPDAPLERIGDSYESLDMVRSAIMTRRELPASLRDAVQEDVAPRGFS